MSMPEKRSSDIPDVKDASGNGEVSPMNSNEAPQEDLDEIINESSEANDVSPSSSSSPAKPRPKDSQVQVMNSRLGRRWTCPLLHLPETGPGAGIPRMSCRVNSLVIEDPFEKGHLLCSAPECQEKICQELTRAVRILSDSSRSQGGRLKLLLQRSDEEEGQTGQRSTNGNPGVQDKYM